MWLPRANIFLHMRTKIATLGLIMLTTPFFAHATTDLSSITLPYTDAYGTWTDYVQGCANGADGGDSICDYWITFFFNTNSSDQINNPIDLNNVYAQYDTISGYVLHISAGSEYFICNQTYTECNQSGAEGWIPVKNHTNPEGYNRDVTRYFYSTRNIYATSSALLATASTSLQTRIVTTDPTHQEIVATSTTIGASVYISPEDYREGMYLLVNMVNNTLSATGGFALDAWNAAFGGIRFTLNSGVNNVSTTTIFDRIGQVNVNWYVKTPNTTPLIGWFFADQTIVASSTKFVVVEMTALDIVMASTSDVLINALITGTTTQSVIRCNPFNFDITVCVLSLLYPSQEVLKSNFDRLRNDLLEKWPLGYVTRIIDILNASTTTSIPVINATIPTGIAGAGSTIYLDPNGAIDYILNASASDSGFGSSTDTLYETTSYYWNILVYTLLALYILRRILPPRVGFRMLVRTRTRPIRFLGRVM